MAIQPISISLYHLPVEVLGQIANKMNISDLFNFAEVILLSQKDAGKKILSRKAFYPQKNFTLLVTALKDANQRRPQWTNYVISLLKAEGEKISPKQLLPISVSNLVAAGRDLENRTKELLLLALQGNFSAVDTLFQQPPICANPFTLALLNAINNSTGVAQSGYFNEMDGSNIELFISAAEEGHVEVIQELMRPDRSKEISKFALGSAFRSAAEENHVEVIQELMRSDRFEEIADSSLDSAFRLAAERGNLKVLQALMQSDHFKINADEYAFLSATASGDLQTLKELMGSERFEEITNTFLRYAFLSAAAKDHLEILQALMGSERFRGKEINKFTLGLAFRLAAENGHLKILQALMGSERFKEIIKPTLTNAFILAAEKGHVDIVKELMQSDHFKKIITFTLLKDAFESAVEQGHLGVLQELTGSDHFKEIDQAKLVELYSTALTHSNKQFVRSLIALMPIPVKSQPQPEELTHPHILDLKR